MKKYLSAVLVLLIAIMFVGCGGATIKTKDGTIKTTDKGIQVQDSKGNKTTINSNGDGGVQYQGTNGSMAIGQNLKLPEGYPEDIVPVYDADNITMSAKTTEGYTITYMTKTKIEDISKKYKDVFNKAQDKSIMDSNGSSWISGTLDKYSALVMIGADSSDASNTTVSITLSIKK